MKKRITSFALVLLMVLSSLAVLLPVTGVKAAAADESATTPAMEKYKKVTAEPVDGDWSGVYLIVYEKGKVAFDGNRATLDADNNTVDVTIGDDQTIELEKGHTFTIAKLSNGYSIKSSNGNYIGRTANKNGLDYKINTSYSNELTYVKDKQTVTIKSEGGPTLQCFVQGTSNRFRYYKSAQQAVSLYKLTSDDNPGNPDHTHTPKVDEKGNTVYEYDVDKHYKICTDKNCPNTNGKYDAAAHDFTAWVSAGETEHTHSCKVCGAAYSEEHKWVNAGISGEKVVQNCECGATREVSIPDDANIVFGELGLSNTADLTDLTLLNGVTIKFAQGKNKSNSPKYYTSDSSARLYVDNTMTIVAPSGKLISKIEITFVAASYANKIGTDDSNYSISSKVGTWAGSAENVVFTGTGSSRIESISITTIDAPEFKYATLDIKENIDVNFYVSVPNGYDVANLKTFFNFHRADTSVVGEPVNTENGLLYRFTLKDVAPHLMGENITATLKNGDTVIATLAYSINTYLDNQKKDTTLSDSTKALIESIAAYGDKAADYNNKISDSTTFTGTATADPADMTESKPTIGTTLEGFRFKGVAVRMENNIRIRVSFENTSGAELKFFVKVGDGKETEAILSNGYVYTDLIAPSAYDTEYTIIAKNADGETVGTVSLSVNTYVCMVLKAFPADGTLTNAQAAMRELAIAIYNYGKAAKTAIGA